MNPELEAVRQILERDGYATLFNALPAHEATEVRQVLEEHFSAPLATKRLLKNPFFARLSTREWITQIVACLLGPETLVHHANGRVLCDGSPKPWHHDFDGERSSSHELTMIHVMLYPDGLPPGVAPLCVAPGTHRELVPRNAPEELMRTSPRRHVQLQSMVPFIVVLNSALWHMRPASRSGSIRYDLNISYCSARQQWSERDEYRQDLSAAANYAGPRWFTGLI